jgi:hypothetical protein
MENMSLPNKIQIGMLGLVILLQLLQLSGIFDSSSSDLRQQAAQELNSGIAPTTGITPTATMPQQPAIQGQPAPASNPAQQPVQPATPPVPTGPTTKMSFNEEVWDFGTVKEGKKVEHIYKFKNTGNEPLVISNASGSCGCTVPQWPKEPIAPGKSGEIKVVFDSEGKAGKRNQEVTIVANTEPSTLKIRMTGEVLAKNGGATTGAAPAQPATPIQVNPSN